MKNLLLICFVVIGVFGILGLISTQPSQEASPNSIVTTDADALPTPGTTATDTSLDSALVGKWWWDSTQMSNGDKQTPAKPNIFSIDLADDGSVLVGTDCNSGRGSYTTTEPNQIAFSPFATTMMFCENSQEAVFMQQLGNTQSYFFTPEGKLVLEIKFDSGSMLFTKAE